MTISKCLMNDADEILLLYEAARNLQTKKQMVVWPFFEKAYIEREILEQRQWKIIVENSIACNWAITLEDKEIWGQKDNSNAIYIHRICTDPMLRGNRYIDAITAWAKEYAMQMNRQFVRLDTLGNNTSLIKHYTSAGFEFLGMFTLTDTASLPAHYQNEPNCCLFEMEAKNNLVGSS
jgi:ribosomal protein S18 acetylase RimI-like enzyme